MTRPLVALTAATVALFARAVHAEPSRAISAADSASPDAPVTSYAWAPGARLSLGADLTVQRLSRARLGFRALLAFAGADVKRVFPADLGRLAMEVGLAWPVEPQRSNRELELGVSLGRESAFSLQSFVLADRFHADDVPFGAGGFYLGIDAAFRAVPRSDWAITTRVALHLYTNLFPDLVGASEVSNLVADQLREGAELKGIFEVRVRYTKSRCYQPVALFYMDAVEPHDDSAHPLFLARAVLSVALPRNGIEIQPFVDVEAGHADGLLVNRNQLRSGAGVRLYAN